MTLSLCRLLCCFSLGFVFTIFSGCDNSDRQRVSNSDYSVVHPQSWNPDGHPGIFLYYKNKPLWFNVYCPDYGYQDGILVFNGDIPDSLFNGQPTGNESSDMLSPQLLVIRGAEPPVIISEQITHKSLKDSQIRLQHFNAISNGFDVTFVSGWSESKPTNIIVTWQEIKSWLNYAETNAPIRNSRMGKYRYLPVKQP